jgi:hypothetical protein
MIRMGEFSRKDGKPQRVFWKDRPPSAAQSRRCQWQDKSEVFIAKLGTVEFPIFWHLTDASPLRIGINALSDHSHLRCFFIRVTLEKNATND